MPQVVGSSQRAACYNSKEVVVKDLDEADAFDKALDESMETKSAAKPAAKASAMPDFDPLGLDAAFDSLT